MPTIPFGADLVIESYARGWQVGRPDPVVIEGRRSFVLRAVTYHRTPIDAIRAAIRRFLTDPKLDVPSDQLDGAISLSLRLSRLERLISKHPEFGAVYDRWENARLQEQEGDKSEGNR